MVVGLVAGGLVGLPLCATRVARPAGAGPARLSRVGVTGHRGAEAAGNRARDHYSVDLRCVIAGRLVSCPALAGWPSARRKGGEGS